MVRVVAMSLLLLEGIAAARPSGREVVEQTNQRLRQLISSNAPPEKITREMRGLFDIAILARRALVDHWDEMSTAQRDEVTRTLREVVERNYVSQLRQNLKYQVKYVGEEPQGEDVLVRTTIQAERKGRPFEISVDYLLHPEGDSWRVYDIVTDEVSLLKNYRSQFNRIIAKEGVDGLIRRMKAKLVENKPD